MTHKLAPHRKAIREARAKRKRTTRIITYGFLALLAAGITWLAVSSIQSKQPSNAMPELVGTKQYSGAPPMLIDVTLEYFASVKMANGGEFIIQLYPDKAPVTVNNFVFLAREGYYDGVTFHRVLEGFMAQGGDPTGSGSGGPGYEFENEVSDLLFDKPGVVAMANAGKDTNGSQFFIMFNEYGLKPEDYTIFGQVIEGMEVVNAITRREPSTADFPGDAIQSITITESQP